MWRWLRIVDVELMKSVFSIAVSSAVSPGVNWLEDMADLNQPIVSVSVQVEKRRHIASAITEESDTSHQLLRWFPITCEVNKSWC
jgi:hypothetical protein